MSNRRRPLLTRSRLEQLARCPDCLAEVRVLPGSPGQIQLVEVRHDDTCPWFAARGEHRQLVVAKMWPA
jgi:hypothetical protein